MVLFDHIAIAVLRMAEAGPILANVLGGVPDFGGDALTGQFRWGQWRFEGGGRIELLEPIGSDGFLGRFLAAHGPGVHHVTFKVKDLREACDRAQSHGYSVVGYDDADPYWKEAFLHPRQAMGIVVQIAQSALDMSVLPPPPHLSIRPPDGTPPVRLWGLRCRARSAEAAARQWAVVLGGEVEHEMATERVYRWPGSPMRLAIEIDATSDEGPVCLEYESDRHVALPDSSHPLLGAPIRRRADRG
jgi:methylmalonyl-CoA/ethylmalonyl-CoA epimerase